MRRILGCFLIWFTTVSAAGPTTTGAGDDALLDKYRAQATEIWETEVRQLEARDAAEPSPADAILFVGSSSIRLWDTIATDMAPYRVIQRGVGGSTYSDIAVFARRLLLPHRYRALVQHGSCTAYVSTTIPGKCSRRISRPRVRWRTLLSPPMTQP